MSAPCGPSTFSQTGVPGAERLRDAVDRDAGRVLVVRVLHARRGRAVVEEVHDPGDRVHPQEGADVLTPVVEDVLALRVRTAVRADVRADRADRAVLVDDERAFRVVERVLAATAVARREQVLVAVEDVDAARAGRGDLDGVRHPAVTEVVLVVGRRDRRVLGVRTVLELVRRLVVTRRELELVVDVVLARGRDRARRSGGTGTTVPVFSSGVPSWSSSGSATRTCDPGARDHPGRRRVRRRPSTRVAGHERDLVVGVEHRVRVGAGVGVRVGVPDDVHRVRGAVVRRAEVDDLALVDLHRDLGPARTRACS